MALKLYVDGQLATSIATTRVPQNELGCWRVGFEETSGWDDSPTNNHFAGTISDVAFYNVELTSAQVSAQYFQGRASVPPSPTNVNATVGTGSATVSWTAPPSNPGAPITGYVITPFANGVAEPPKRYDSTALSEVVTGLSKGTTYRFTVAGVNGYGTGPQSSLSNAISPK